MIPAAMDLKSHLQDLLSQALAVVAPDIDMSIELERPKQAAHGDFACNLAMKLAKVLKRNPRELAQALQAALPNSAWLLRSEIAGAGFLNLFFTPTAKQAIVAHVLQTPEFGRSHLGAGQRVQVEFVSANPTGPLHVGHGRGAAYGASVANLLAAAGWDVQREYYVNDAGRQMDILALSTWLRYLELTGQSLAFPPNAYQGDYVRGMARQLLDNHGLQFVREVAQLYANAPSVEEDKESHLDTLIANAKTLLGSDYPYVHQHALNEQLEDCRQDLTEFGVVYDEWFSEKSLYDTGLVAKAVQTLEQSGHIYTANGAKWFRSTAFGDEKDRVVQRENGLFTYFASDIAYHLNKFDRGFSRVINIWGADHHGYIPRVKAALQACGQDAERLDIALVQFATLWRQGEQVQMSTRSGSFVTLRELRAEVGNDATRFFYILRRSEQHLDFDLDLAKSQSNDNPVYYIQYAHARICRVLEEWGGETASLVNADLTPLVNAHEYTLMEALRDFPTCLQAAARDLAPHTLAFYLKELAANLHSYYNAERFLVDDPQVSQARMALITAVKQVLRHGLQLLGVSALEKM